MTQACVSASWIATLLEAFRELSLDPTAALRAAGLNPRQPGRPHGRIAITSMHAFWAHCCASFGADIGLRAGHRSDSSKLHAFTAACHASASPLETMQCISRYTPVLSDAARWSLQTGSEAVAFEFIPSPRARVHHAGIDAVFAAATTQLKRIHGSQFAASRIELARPCPADPTPWQELLGCPVAFDSPGNCLHWPHNAWPGSRADDALDEDALSDELVEHYLQHFETDPMATNVRAEVVRQLPFGEPTLATVAEAVGCSTRTLQRRLDDANTSFSGLIRTARQDLCTHFLADSRYSLKEVAFLLGFSDQANFSRAFKAWYGLAPGRFRRQLGHRPG